MYCRYLLVLFIGCSMSSRALYGMDSCDMQEVSPQKRERTFWKDVLDGAVAGGIEVMCNNPLVVIKNNLILSKETSASGKGVLKAFSTQLANPKGMIKKYYKGCGTGIASMAPITALQNSIAFLLGKGFGDAPTLAQRTVAAFGAGCISALLGSPSDLVVLQRQNPLYSGETLMGTLRRIYGVKGLATVYRGISGTAARDGIFTAAYKTGGDAINSVIPSITGNPEVDVVLCASLAGVIAAVLSHPADVIAARMKSDLEVVNYKTVWQTASTLVKEERASALFKGLAPRAFRIMLAIPLISAMLQWEVGTKAAERIVANRS